MPRRQQRGAGLLDFLSSDPSKKKEANLKQIEELKKDSEKKCEEVKKNNAVKIEKLNADNMKLDKMIEEKNAEAKSPGLFSGLFSGAKDDAASKESDAKAVPGKKDSGLFSGFFSGSDEKPVEEEKPKMAVEKPMMSENPMVKPQMEEEKRGMGNRMFSGGKKRKSQRRRKSKARKSAKK